MNSSGKNNIGMYILKKGGTVKEHYDNYWKSCSYRLSNRIKNSWDFYLCVQDVNNSALWPIEFVVLNPQKLPMVYSYEYNPVENDKYLELISILIDAKSVTSIPRT